MPSYRCCRPGLGARYPDASFYLWLNVPGGDDLAFTRKLWAQEHITVLPGSFLARDAHGINPGKASSGLRWLPRLMNAWKPPAGSRIVYKQK